MLCKAAGSIKNFTKSNSSAQDFDLFQKTILHQMAKKGTYVIIRKTFQAIP